MSIQERTIKGKTQYRWGNSGTWYSSESQAHKQGVAIQKNKGNRLYIQKKKLGHKAVKTQLRKRKMLEQAGK